MDGLRSPSVLMLCCLLGAACAGPEKVSGQKFEEVSAHFLAPFAEQRAIVTDTLEVDFTANFNAEVSRPALSRELHEMSVERTPQATEYRYRNLSGGVQMPLRFQIGNSTFVVLHQAILRIPEGRSDLRLTAVASGQVSVAEAGSIHQLQELRFEDGTLQRR